MVKLITVSADTELVYTLNGMEVAEISLVDMEGRFIMDQYVVPKYQVPDYNTAFSGMEAQHLEKSSNVGDIYLIPTGFADLKNLMMSLMEQADNDYPFMNQAKNRAIFAAKDQNRKS